MALAQTPPCRLSGGFLEDQHGIRWSCFAPVRDNWNVRRGDTMVVNVSTTGVPDAIRVDYMEHTRALSTFGARIRAALDQHVEDHGSAPRYLWWWVDRIR